MLWSLPRCNVRYNDLYVYVTMYSYVYVTISLPTTYVYNTISVCIFDT